MLGDGRCRSQKAWLCWRRISRAQLWGDTPPSLGPLLTCHQPRLSSGLHELLWPAQARLSQISLSLINQNIHLSRDILFIIAGSFIGGRSGGLRVRRVASQGREWWKWFLGTWYEPHIKEHGRDDWCSVRNKLMFSSCLSKRDKMIRLGPGCLRLSVSAARAHKSWELEI